MDESGEGKESAGRTGGGRRCPICGRPAEQRWRPFCSRRCADVDLNRWLSGAYAVPVLEPDEEDAEALENPPRTSGDGDRQD